MADKPAPVRGYPTLPHPTSVCDRKATAGFRASGITENAPGDPRWTAIRLPARTGGALAIAVMTVCLGTGSAAAGPETIAAALAGCDPGQAERCSDAYFNRCAEAGGWSTQAMVRCQDTLAGHWDARLNGIYVEVMEGATDVVKRDLRAAQRTWIRWRDARCGFYKHFQGPMPQVAAAGCTAETTRQRVHDLEVIRDYLP